MGNGDGKGNVFYVSEKRTHSTRLFDCSGSFEALLFLLLCCFIFLKYFIFLTRCSFVSVWLAVFVLNKREREGRCLNFAEFVMQNRAKVPRCTSWAWTCLVWSLVYDPRAWDTNSWKYNRFCVRMQSTQTHSFTYWLLKHTESDSWRVRVNGALITCRRHIGWEREFHNF